MKTLLITIISSSVGACVATYLIMNIYIKLLDRFTTGFLIKTQDITNEYLQELRKKAINKL